MPQILKIASWNINSVRARIDLVTRFLQEEAPDILCLQETKVTDDIFPGGVFRQMGYNHHILHGQPMHHGVAIIRTWFPVAQYSWSPVQAMVAAV